MAATNARTAPPQTMDSSAYSLWAHQQSVGTCQNREAPNCSCDFGKEFRHGVYSLRADQTPDLAPEGDEGDAVNQCQGAGE